MCVVVVGVGVRVGAGGLTFSGRHHKCGSVKLLLNLLCCSRLTGCFISDPILHSSPDVQQL